MELSSEVAPSINAQEVGQANETVLQELEMLSDADYRQTMVEAFDGSRDISTIKKISGFWLDKSKKLAKRIGAKAEVEGVELQGIAISGPLSSAQLRSVPALSSSAQLRKSAWQTPFIFRGDKVPTNGVVFLDTEKVSLRIDQSNTLYGKKMRHSQVAATLAVVNEQNDLILWSFIKRENVCQFFPSITRLDKSKLSEGLDIAMVQDMLKMALKGNTVAGLDIANDLESLGMSIHDFKFLELQQFYRDDAGPLSARTIAGGVMNMKDFQCGVHSAIADARFTRDIYLKIKELQAAGNLTCPSVPRIKNSAFVFTKTDVCKCKRLPYR